MTNSPRTRTAVAVLLALLGILPRTAIAQSASQLGAWDGLTLSPVGALAPVARDPGDLAAGVNEFLLRYGRWRYDADDAVHDNIGLTWSHSLGFAQTQMALSVGTEVVECPTCDGWQFFGVDLESTAWNHAVGSVHGRPIATSAGLRLSLGGARFTGSTPASTQSAALAVPIDFALPVGRSSYVCASVVPGMGYGRITSVDVTQSGVLPMIGAAVTWTIGPRFGVDVGMQRIIIGGGPTQIGAAFSWKLHVRPKPGP